MLAFAPFATAIIAALILQTQGVPDASHDSIASAWSCRENVRCHVCKPCGKHVDTENVWEYSCECRTYRKRLRSESSWEGRTYRKRLIPETVRPSIRFGKLSTSITTITTSSYAPACTWTASSRGRDAGVVMGLFILRGGAKGTHTIQVSGSGEEPASAAAAGVL